MCSFRRKSRAGWYRIARKTAHTAGPHACGLARVTGLWCGSAFIPLTGRLPRSLPRLLAASWRHAFLRSPARRCPACRSQLFRCADRPVSAGGSLSAAASAVRVRSRGPAVAGRLRARRGSFGRRRRGRGPACIEVVRYGCDRAALARPPSLRSPGRRGPGLRVVQGGFFAPGGCVAGLASGACHPGVAPPPGVPAGRRQPVWCARWDPRRGQVQCFLALGGRGPVERTEVREIQALLQTTQCRKKLVANCLT